MRNPTIAKLLCFSILGAAYAGTPESANAQIYESDWDYKSRISMKIDRVRKRIEKYQEEIGRVGYSGVSSQLGALLNRCDYQEKYLSRMSSSSMSNPQEVGYARRAIEDDIRNVEREFSKIKRRVKKMDEEDIEDEKKRAERDALEEEIMKEEW